MNRKFTLKLSDKSRNILSQVFLSACSVLTDVDKAFDRVKIPFHNVMELKEKCMRLGSLANAPQTCLFEIDDNDFCFILKMCGLVSKELDDFMLIYKECHKYGIESNVAEYKEDVTALMKVLRVSYSEETDKALLSLKKVMKAKGLKYEKEVKMRNFQMKTREPWRRGALSYNILPSSPFGEIRHLIHYKWDRRWWLWTKGENGIWKTKRISHQLRTSLLNYAACNEVI